MAGDQDRLSALGDDLLRRILYFTPAKEAATTSVLSRRWRHLYRSSGAVNLVVHVPNDASRHYQDCQRTAEAEVAFFAYRDAFLREADAAIDAADARVKRLTLRLEGNGDDVYKFLNRTRDWEVDADVVGTVVSHPAVRHVEELRIAPVEVSDEYNSSNETMHHGGMYSLHFLPYETLRVLDLSKCWQLTLPGPVAFPRLVTLRLRFCGVETLVVQAMIDAAPELTTMRFESVHFGTAKRMPRAGSFDESSELNYEEEDECLPEDSTTKEAPTLRLHCQDATTLVLAMCSLVVEDVSLYNCAIEIEARRLRSLTYKGKVRPFLLRRPAPDIAHVDLHLHHERNEDTTRILFWQFVKIFSNAKDLKIKVNNLEEIAAIGKASRAEHLCLFPGVERLELEGLHDPTSKKDAVAIANMLRCCPALQNLRLKLSTVASDSDTRSYSVEHLLERKDRLDYDKSLDRFMHRCPSKPMISMNEDYGEVSDIPGLRGRLFPCLQNSLRRVGLQFRLDGPKPNCFGVRLIRFFAENAMVLEELSIDSGNRRLSEHMNLNIERWIAPNNSSKACLKRKHHAESSWEFSRNLRVCTDSARDCKTNTNSFTFTPLQR